MVGKGTDVKDKGLDISAHIEQGEEGVEHHKFSDGRHFCSSCLQRCNNTAEVFFLLLTVLDFIFKVVMWAQPKHYALNKKANILGYIHGWTNFAATFTRVSDSLGDCLLMKYNYRVSLKKGTLVISVLFLF